jgi:threonine/homoserine/homoserine lactone efflux protein
MILLIILPFLISFISFLTPTGPITVLIFRNTLLSKYGRAIMIILGATIVQFFYSGFSLFLVNEILSETLKATAKIISTFVFLTLGVHLITSKPKKSNKIIRLKDLPTSEKSKSFLIGFFITLLNPSIIFSWLAAISLLISFNILLVTSHLDILIFSTSAIAGVLLGSFTMMYLVHSYRDICSDKINKKILKTLGVIVISLGLYFFFTTLNFFSI